MISQPSSQTNNVSISSYIVKGLKWGVIVSVSLILIVVVLDIVGYIYSQGTCSGLIGLGATNYPCSFQQYSFGFLGLLAIALYFGIWIIPGILISSILIGWVTGFVKSKK